MARVIEWWTSARSHRYALGRLARLHRAIRACESVPIEVPGQLRLEEKKLKAAIEELRTKMSQNDPSNRARSRTAAAPPELRQLYRQIPAAPYQPVRRRGRHPRNRPRDPNAEDGASGIRLAVVTTKGEDKWRKNTAKALRGHLVRVVAHHVESVRESVKRQFVNDYRKRHGRAPGEAAQTTSTGRRLNELIADIVSTFFPDFVPKITGREVQHVRENARGALPTRRKLPRHPKRSG